MKKCFLICTLIIASTSLFAQSEAYFQSIDDLLYKSNRSTAILLMKQKHKDFRLVSGTVEVVDSVWLIVEGQKKRVAYERLVYVSESNNAILQYIFVDDMLYGKNISWYYLDNQASAAEEKYNSLNNALINSNEVQLLMSGSGDEVYFTDDQVAAGKIRHYPAQRVQYDVWEGTTGFILNLPDINKLDNVNQSKGYWVFLTVYNTFDMPLSTKYNFPKVNPPYETIEELWSRTSE